MAIFKKLNNQGYLQFKGQTEFTVMQNARRSTGIVNLKDIHLPKNLIGRKVRVKIEIL